MTVVSKVSPLHYLILITCDHILTLTSLIGNPEHGVDHIMEVF